MLESQRTTRKSCVNCAGKCTAYQHHIMCYIVLHCYAAPLYFFTECSKKRAEFRYNLDPQTRNGFCTNNEEAKEGGRNILPSNISVVAVQFCCVLLISVGIISVSHLSSLLECIRQKFSLTVVTHHGEIFVELKESTSAHDPISEQI